MDAPECLFGSSVLPSLISIGAREVQLGEVVRRAQHDSELTAQEWNDLQAIEREWWCVAAIYKMRAEAAEVGADA